MVTKRGFTITDPLDETLIYSTATEGWTLSAWELDPAETVTNYVDVPGRTAGPLDLSTALTDGRPTYGSRALSVTLECSEGTRADRILKIKELTRHTGYVRHITTPDDDKLHLVGRIIAVRQNYNDLAHASVTLTAVCEPFKYADTERSEIYHGTTVVAVQVKNEGDIPVVPMIEVSNVSGSFELSVNDGKWQLIAGTYILPGFVLKPGRTTVTMYGLADVKLTFTEAFL